MSNTPHTAASVPDDEPSDLTPVQKALRLAVVRRLEAQHRVVTQLTGSPTLGAMVNEPAFIEFLSNTVVQTADQKESALTLELYLEMFSRFLVIPEELKVAGDTPIPEVGLAAVVDFIQSLPRFLAQNGMTSYCLYPHHADPTIIYADNGKIVAVPARKHLYYNDELKQLRVIIGYINLDNSPGNQPRAVLVIASNGSVYSVDLNNWSAQHQALT